MEIYEVSLRIQSERRKIQTRKNSVFGHISHGGYEKHFECLIVVFVLYSPGTLLNMGVNG